MKRLRFPLSSDQLELLLAFESATGLGHLSEIIARDASVVSRNLQRIAEAYPVLVKVRGRWELTPLGVQVNQRTRHYLEDNAKLFAEMQSEQKISDKGPPQDSVLILVNAQVGLLDGTQEGRNNLDAEINIIRILTHWRKHQRRIVHVKHVSDKADSIFFRNSSGVDFLDWAMPKENEFVVEKMKSSAFSGTELENYLNKEAASSVVLVGFTANECIDAAARDASALGLNAYVVGDATATFDFRDHIGKLIKADRIHRLTLMNINAFYAKVIDTIDVLV